jgi:hypothetical protein
MSLLNAAVFLALGSGVLAYVMPLILWMRMRPEFPNSVLIVPALSLTSWLIAEYAGVGPVKVGFTFLGAIPVAVISNLIVLAGMLLKSAIRRHHILSTLGIMLLSVLVGVGMRLLLPALPD